MIVGLVSYTSDPEFVVASAAKLCYSSNGFDSAEYLKNGLSDREIGKYIENLFDMGHLSPFEHASFTFYVEGVSRTLLAQLTRHRIASYSVQSQRYVNMSNASFVVPNSIKDNEKLLNVYDEYNKVSLKTYFMLLNELKDKYIKSGIDEKEARKKAQEDARFVLPNSCTTCLMLTMNARELLHFFELRCCNRAQWEIRAMAGMMLEICKKVAPSIFKKAGPSCVRGICKEGKMSCGDPWEIV